MADINLVNPDLIKLNLEVADKEEVLDVLAKTLISNGYAKESFLEAVKEREKVFPTGLPTEGIGVAIPHADSKHILKPGIAIAILKNPVKFNVMGSPEEEVDVRIVFMLAILDPNMQLGLLQDLMSICQQKQLLMELLEADGIDSVINILKKPFPE